MQEKWAHRCSKKAVGESLDGRAREASQLFCMAFLRNVLCKHSVAKGKGKARHRTKIAEGPFEADSP